MFNLIELEKRETPSYVDSFNGNVRISSYIEQVESGFINLNEFAYKPFSDYTGNLNSVFLEEGKYLAVAPTNNGGPRVQVSQINFENEAREVLYDDYLYEITFNGGVNVAMDDINNDGFKDLIVGPNIGGGPRLRVLSGEDNFETVLFDDFVYESSYRGGIEVGAYNGKVFTLPKEGGGPRLRILDITDNTSLDYFIGDPSSREQRQLLYGTLLGIRENYFANYENGILHLYDNNGKLLVKNVMPYTVQSIGVGGNFDPFNNRLMVTGNLNSPFVNNNNGLEIIEHDPIINTFLATTPYYQPNGKLGIAVNKINIFDQLLENPQMKTNLDQVVPTPTPVPLGAYDFVSPFRANLGTVYPGQSIGNVQGGTGTFTALVKDNETGKILGLTNWHVLSQGTAYSPGRADLKETLLPSLQVGEFERSLGVNFEKDAVNLIDSSLFSLFDTRQISKDVLITVDKNRNPITITYIGKATVEKGDIVYGFGRTSGARPGIVQSNNHKTLVGYQEGDVLFEDQIHILSTILPFGFAVPGDSGSIVMKPMFDGSGNIRWFVAGQIFAGDNIFGIASKWENIENLLGVELVL